MHSYVFQAKQGTDSVIDVVVTAESKEEAVQKVEAMGLTPIRVTEKSAPQSQSFYKSHFSFPGWKRGAGKNLTVFTWQFASLLRAGVPVLQALTLLAQQSYLFSHPKKERQDNRIFGFYPVNPPKPILL